MRRLASLALLMTLLIGCGQPEVTPSPVATIPLATQPPVGTVTPEVCMAALLQGPLVLDARSGLAIALNGVVQRVRWPYGWTGRATTPVTLVNAQGNVVARVGDFLAVGGGAGGPGLGLDGFWEACPYDIRVVPTPGPS